jgi:hypothetical protein
MKSGQRPPSGLGDAEATVVGAFRRGLIKLNISDQKAVFNRLPPGLRAALWKDRIREAVSASRNKEQKEILQKIAARITPAVYDDRSSIQRKQFLAFYRELQPEALAAFRSNANSFAAISTLLGKRNNAPPIAQSSNLLSCNCSIAARESECDDCDENTNCKRIPCVATKFGCGCWWTQRCDGICK